MESGDIVNGHIRDAGYEIRQVTTLHPYILNIAPRRKPAVIKIRFQCWNIRVFDGPRTPSKHIQRTNDYVKGEKNGGISYQADLTEKDGNRAARITRYNLIKKSL